MGMMRIRRGDVYIAQFAAFPHEKEAPGKERPVVIAQNELALKSDGVERSTMCYSLCSFAGNRSSFPSGFEH